MNDTLKAAGRIGAELGAAKAENEKLRKALKRIIDRCEAFVDDEAEMRTPSVEVLMGIAEDAIYTVHLADAALSRQSEPTDTYTAVDMATAAAQGFRDGQAAVEQDTAQDDIAAFVAAYSRAFGGPPQIEGEDVNRHALMAWWGWTNRPAQTEQQPILAVRVEADCVEHVHPEYGGGYFFTEDAIVEMYAAPIAQTAISTQRGES